VHIIQVSALSERQRRSLSLEPTEQVLCCDWVSACECILALYAGGHWSASQGPVQPLMYVMSSRVSMLCRQTGFNEQETTQGQGQGGFTPKSRKMGEQPPNYIRPSSHLLTLFFPSLSSPTLYPPFIPFIRHCPGSLILRCYSKR